LQDNLNVQFFVATDEARKSQKPAETPKPGSPNSGNLHQTKCGSHSFIDRDCQELTWRLA
jgi:hypothetical protein